MDHTLMSTLDADRKRAVENVREAAGRIWARPLHRYYTDHTVTHSERIIALLDGLTSSMMATDRHLLPTEVFVLLCAAYLHDIGMQNENLAKVLNLRKVDLDTIRAHHHEQSAEMIYKVFEDPANAFAIPLARDPGLVEAVALVSKGHRKVDLSAAEYESFVHGGETVRLRLLAALLRFGDELDIDYRRVDLETMKLMAVPVESQLHWWKCHYVSGVSIVDEYIKIAYRLPQDRPDYEGLVKPLVENEVRARLASLEEIFRANAVKVAIGKSEVRLMRLVQQMPTEVEKLAREIVGRGASSVERESGQGDGVTRRQGDKVTGGKRQEAGSKKQEAGRTRQKARGAGKKPETPAKKRKKSSAPAASTTVFDQRRQKVGKQINVAGNYVDQKQNITIVGDSSTNRVVKGAIQDEFSNKTQKLGPQLSMSTNIEESPPTPADVQAGAKRSWFIRLKIENNGQTPATNCFGRLLEVVGEKGEHFEQFDSLDLYWRRQDSPRNYQRLDIRENGDYQYLNIAQVKEAEDVLSLRVLVPEGQRLVKPIGHIGKPEDLPPGTYYMRIAIYADGASIEPTWFKVEWCNEYPPEGDHSIDSYPCRIDIEEPLLPKQ